MFFNDIFITYLIKKMKDIEYDKKDDNQEINAENEKVIQIKPSSDIFFFFII